MENERIKNPKAYRAEQPLTKQMRLDGGKKKPAAKPPLGKKMHRKSG